jgi:hypothetical protein
MNSQVVFVFGMIVGFFTGGLVSYFIMRIIENKKLIFLIEQEKKR